MASRLRKRIAIRGKLQILGRLTRSKSVTRRSIIMDAFIYIYKLKLQLEAIKKQYQCLMQHIQEVKVEKIGKGYAVRVTTCKKGQHLLVSILEAFEAMSLNVVHAKLTCNYFFGMEAIVEPDDEARAIHDVTVRDITQAVHLTIQKQSGSGDEMACSRDM